jgi:hypothetical protein
VSRLNDRNRVPIRNRHGPEDWMTAAERADMLSFKLTKAQTAAIMKDTRLPGEITFAYKTSAAVILRIQQKARKRSPK